MELPSAARGAHRLSPGLRLDVLVVEDDGVVASDLRQTLRDLGFEPFAAAASGAEAMSLARERPPALVLMDIRLRGAMDGIETATHLRRLYGSEIIFLTAYADDATIERARAAEPSGYLIKPVGVPDLKAVLALSVDQRARARRLRLAGAQLTQVLDHMNIAVFVENSRGGLVFLNRHFTALFGFEPALAPAPAAGIGEHIRRLAALSEDAAGFMQRMQALRVAREPAAGELIRLRDGRVLERDYVPLEEDSAGLDHLWAWRDVSERERARAAVEASATHNRRLVLIDELTGLHSRRGFYNLADVYLRFMHRSERTEQLFFIDLDNFKAINDRFGHAAGDDALRQMAAALRESFSGSELIARLGGDEFVVLGSLESEKVPAVRRRFLDRLDAFNASGQAEYRLEASVGVAQYEPGEPLQALLERADRSMYCDKRQRRKLLP